MGLLTHERDAAAAAVAAAAAATAAVVFGFLAFSHLDVRRILMRVSTSAPQGGHA